MKEILEGLRDKRQQPEAIQLDDIGPIRPLHQKDDNHCRLRRMKTAFCCSCPEGYGCNQSKRPTTNESFKSKSDSVSGNDIAVAIASKGIVSSGNPTASSRTNMFACTKPTTETTAPRRLTFGKLDCQVPIISAEAGGAALAEPRFVDTTHSEIKVKVIPSRLIPGNKKTNAW